MLEPIPVSPIKLELTDRDLLVKIDTKLDIYIARVLDHEARIRLLEKFQWITVGIAVAISTGLSYAVAVLRGH